MEPQETKHQVKRNQRRKEKYSAKLALKNPTSNTHLTAAAVIFIHSKQSLGFTGSLEK